MTHCMISANNPDSHILAYVFRSVALLNADRKKQALCIIIIIIASGGGGLSGRFSRQLHLPSKDFTQSHIIRTYCKCLPRFTSQPISTYKRQRGPRTAASFLIGGRQLLIKVHIRHLLYWSMDQRFVIFLIN